MTDYPVKSLDHVSLEVNDGEFIAIMGPSGSGKNNFNSMSVNDGSTHRWSSLFIWSTLISSLIMKFVSLEIRKLVLYFKIINS